MRIALASFPERYDLPPRPAAGAPAEQDAHRQTRFLLAGDLALLERAMSLQLQIVAANAKARPGERPSGRDPRAAALLGYWSRVFSYLADACDAAHRGSYASCPPLLRTACDCIAAQRSLLADGFADYLEWFPAAFRQDKRHAAFAVALGRFRAGSALAEDERLGAAYRLLTELSMPHFGSTALQAAPDSNLQKLSLSFARVGFHLGWTELVVGWLLMLADAQLDVALGSGLFAIPRPLGDSRSALQREIESALASPRRCRAEETGEGGYLIHGFRRLSSGTPRRILL